MPFVYTLSEMMTYIFKNPVKGESLKASSRLSPQTTKWTVSANLQRCSLLCKPTARVSCWLERRYAFPEIAQRDAFWKKRLDIAESN